MPFPHHAESESMPIAYRTINPGDDAAVRALYESVQMSHAGETGDPAIIAYARAHVDEVFASDLAAPCAYYTLPGHRCWVAEAGGGLVGMAGIESWPGIAGVARLRHVMVDSRWRRQGIASTILDNAERWCAAQGYRAVRLNTTALNAVAVEIYRKRGYVELERVMGHVAIAYTMEKSLRAVDP